MCRDPLRFLLQRCRMTCLWYFLSDLLHITRVCSYLHFIILEGGFYWTVLLILHFYCQAMTIFSIDYIANQYILQDFLSSQCYQHDQIPLILLIQIFLSVNRHICLLIQFSLLFIWQDLSQCHVKELILRKGYFEELLAGLLIDSLTVLLFG